MTKFKIFIKEITVSVIEIELESNSIMEAFDEINQIVKSKNSLSNNKTNYHISKIEEIKNE